MKTTLCIVTQEQAVQLSGLYDRIAEGSGYRIIYRTEAEIIAGLLGGTSVDEILPTKYPEYLGVILAPMLIKSKK